MHWDGSLARPARPLRRAQTAAKTGFSPYIHAHHIHDTYKHALALRFSRAFAVLLFVSFRARTVLALLQYTRTPSEKRPGEPCLAPGTGPWSRGAPAAFHFLE